MTDRLGMGALPTSMSGVFPSGGRPVLAPLCPETRRLEGLGTWKRRKTVQPTYVYLAVMRDAQATRSADDPPRFKIGVSVAPLRRFLQLTEGPAIDVQASIQRLLPSAERAYEVESALHKVLAPLGINAWHGGSGYTEWFRSQGLGLARLMLDAVPDALEDSSAPVALEPSAAIDPAADNLARLETVADAWLRLRRLAPLRVTKTADGGYRLVAKQFKSGVVPALSGLRMSLMGADGLYDLRQGVLIQSAEQPCKAIPEAPHPVSLVRLVSFAGTGGQDLVIELQPMAHLAAMPGGRAYVQALRHLLRRVRDSKPS